MEEKVDRLFNILLKDITEEEVKHVIVGLNWTLVETNLGAGVAYTPAKDLAGCYPIPDSGKLCNRSLTDLAKLVWSKNPLERCIGMAGINSFKVGALFSDRLWIVSTTRMIYFFIFIKKEMETAAINLEFEKAAKLRDEIKFLQNKEVRVIEREPLAGEFDETQSRKLLKSSYYSVITSSTFVNGTAAKLISWGKHGKIMILGPGTPLCGGLFNEGINYLSGFVIRNKREARIVVSEGGAVKDLKEVGKMVVLESN